MANEVNGCFNMGDNYWDLVIDGYLQDARVKEAMDKVYGNGASEFMGRALQYYFHN